MKKIIYLGLFLGAIATIATLAMAFVNEITAPIIAEAQDELYQQQLRAAFPDATRHVTVSSNTPFTLDVIRALDGDNLLGYIYVQETVGYNDVVRYMVAVDSSGIIRNFLNLYNIETPGFAEPATLYAWAEDQFIGRPTDTRIDILAHSTITTAPIIEAIHAAHVDFAARR
jgi:electron transport complex protein RnfG